MRCLVNRFAVILFVLVIALGTGVVYADEQIAGTPSGAAEISEPAEPTGSAKLIINEPGTYVLSGKMTQGVTVDVESGEVILVLDDVNIESEDGPGILALHADLLQIEVKDHTFNRIADTSANSYHAAIETEVETVISGTGCLQIEGNSGNAIHAKGANVTFAGGISLLMAEEYAFQMDGDVPGAVFIRGGSVYMNAKKGTAVEGTVIRISSGTFMRTNFTCIKNLYCCLCAAWKCLPKDCFFCADCNNCGCAECECDDCCESTTDTPGEIIHGQITNGAVALEPDMEQAIRIEFDEETDHVVISKGGTYVIAGKCNNGSITIEKGVQGVVLVLDHLELTNQQGAAILAEEGSQVKIVVEGDVTLSDTASASETTTENQAVIQGEKNSEVYITGSGSLELNASAQHGIGMAEDSSLVISGEELKTKIDAKRDGIYSGNDVAVLDGTLTVKAGEDGIHTEHILEIGEEGEEKGPTVDIQCVEDGLESTVVNINSGDITVNAENDAIDANEGTFEGELEASVNITGGTTELVAGDDGIDSDGNVNLIDGELTIERANDEADGCITVDDDLYISDDFELSCECDKDCDDSCEEQSCETSVTPVNTEWTYTSDDALGFLDEAACPPCETDCP